MTVSYQSYPFEANFLTISEACSEDGVWNVNRSQDFSVSKQDLADGYLRVVGIRKKPVPVGPGTSKDPVIEFTVFLAGENNLYKTEFAVKQENSGGLNPNEFSIIRADIFKSVEFNLNQGLTTVAFQPAHHLVPNQYWPDFYIFVTGTRQLTLEELVAAGKKLRMQDGLLLSENYFRT